MPRLSPLRAEHFFDCLKLCFLHLLTVPVPGETPGPWRQRAGKASALCATPVHGSLQIRGQRPENPAHSATRQRRESSHHGALSLRCTRTIAEFWA